MIESRQPNMLYLWLVLYFYLVKEVALEYLHRELWWVIVLLCPAIFETD